MKKKFALDKLFIIVFLIGFTTYSITLIVAGIGSSVARNEAIIKASDKTLITLDMYLFKTGIVQLVFLVLQFALITTSAFLFLFNIPQKYKISNLLIASCIYILLVFQTININFLAFYRFDTLTIVPILNTFTCTALYVWYMTREIRKRREQKNSSNSSRPN